MDAGFLELANNLFKMNEIEMELINKLEIETELKENSKKY